MNRAIIMDYYENRGFDDASAREAVDAIEALETVLKPKGLSLETVDIKTLKEYIENLMSQSLATMSTLLALARYFYLIGSHENYVYFTSILGGLGVIESIQSRLETHSGRATSKTVFSTLEKPPLGSDPTHFPAYTEKLMERLEALLPISDVQKVLAGNNHFVPADKFIEEREKLKGSESLDAYLADYNAREIEILEKHARENKVWFEQIITPEVIDFVKKNQEIMSAVRDGNKLYITKIPYDTVNFLTAQNEREKRYYACHCPFARESILREDVQISPNWCYCSAGFGKYPYEVLFNRPLEIKMLESVLQGNLRCRFVIDLKDVEFK